MNNDKISLAVLQVANKREEAMRVYKLAEEAKKQDGKNKEYFSLQQTYYELWLDYAEADRALFLMQAEQEG